MLDNIDFAKKAIKHRKIQPKITLTGLVICVASTIFLVLLGQSLGLIFNSTIGTRFTNFLTTAITQFIYFDIVLIFIVGMALIYFLFTSMMADRQKDVGLIKALGSKENIGFSYVMAEPMLISIYGCIIGGLLGLSSFIAYSAVFLSGTLLSQIWIYLVMFLGLLVGSFCVSWVISSRKSEGFFKATPMNLFAGDAQNFDFVKEQLTGLKKFLDRLPWKLQIVLKGMIRSRSKSKNATVCLTFCVFLMTVSLAGGAVVWSTTRNYVENSFGQNLIAIGKTPVINEYEAMMTNILGSALHTFNFVEAQFFIEDSFIEKLSSLQQVEVMDSRLIIVSNVVEVQTTEVIKDSFGESHYVTYGSSNARSSTALIVGVNVDAIADNLLSQKESLQSDSVIIGDSLAHSIFDNALKQQISIIANNSNTRKAFSICNTNFDLINQGFVVYMPIEALQTLNSLTGQNLVIVKVQDKGAVSEIERLAKQHGLNILPLDRVQQKSLANIDNLWLSILPFPILSVITTILGLLNCLLVSFSGRVHDFGILRAMGAKSDYNAKMVLIESVAFAAPAAIIGVTLGMIFNLIFFIPSATITPQLLITCTGGLAILLCCMCFISTTVMLKINKQSPNRLIQKTR